MFFFALIVLLIIFSYHTFIISRKNELDSLLTVKTSFGDISYIDINSNKQEVILFCTGGGVGLDSVKAFKWLKTSDFTLRLIW
ncbi:hypothetical protein AN643_03370 [Candidatus Epulonipiscioides saccharophilum]|nr:hypothetical protein AN643_03370 [Epulopiscium sp. SCG-B10WGA-EpuloB]